MPNEPTQRFDDWVAALQERHLANLTFPEVRRGLQALSKIYVARRPGLSDKSLDGAGKRAAFALFYGPLHFALVEGIVRAIGAETPPPAKILDLGCGSGVAGAAWASCCARPPAVTGIDRHAWAVEEARWNLRALDLRGKVQRGELLRAPLPGPGGAVIAAFAVNELADRDRDRLRDSLLAAARRGARVLVVEPIAKTPVPWWPEWVAAFEAAGGRSDEWSFAADLPEPLRALDRAAGLRHERIKGRSLYLPAAA